ncbi:MAG: cupin domain-containing protein [Bacteroidetes bacterium]|nr:cupin domain-containing protein [Bacteroidota bacterium]
MKSIILLISFVFLNVISQGQTTEKLNTAVYDWEKMNVVKTNFGEKRQIFEGHTNVLSYFEVHVTTLNPGKAPHGSHVHSDMEELIIVKEGLIEQSINGVKKVVGPGSVILALPGDDHGIWNAGDTQASYYIIRWKTDQPINLERAKQSGGSKFYDWKDIEFKTTEKGGKRQFMQRPTALLADLEMHVTTLNEGVMSHAEHIHSNEEIIIVLKGEVEESIAGTPHRLGPGSLILLMDEVPHGIKNVGKGQCEYFAFKWKK